MLIWNILSKALLISAENSPPSETRGTRNESERYSSGNIVKGWHDKAVVSLLYLKYLSVFSKYFYTLFLIAMAIQLPLFVRHGDHEGKGWKMKINCIWPRLTLDKIDQMWKHWFLPTGRSWSAGGPLQQMINPANDRWMNKKGKKQKKCTVKT